jgi:hypothetical protein
MVGGPVPRQPATDPTRPMRMLDVVRQGAPGIYESLIKPGSPELDAFAFVIKRALASQNGVTPELSSQIYSLPSQSVATVLLHAYNPAENKPIMITGPDVIEFIARWKGDEERVLPPWSTGNVQGPVPSGTILPGSAQSFQDFVARWHEGPEAGCEQEPEVASSEFSAVYGRVLKAVGEITSKNAEFLTQMAQSAIDFMACLLEAQPKAAADCFRIPELLATDTRNISAMQPEGTFANMGCGKDGIIAINALERPLLLVDRSALLTGILGSYAARRGRKDVTVVNSDIVSATYAPGSVGLGCFEFVLHYLTRPQIEETIGRFVPALAQNGMLHVWEPECGCCGFESRDKINAVRAALARSGLIVREKEHRRNSEILFSPKVYFEWVAARRQSDLEIGTAVRDLFMP